MLIDVVIPIYNAFDALLNCLDSLEANQKGINNVLLINDASSDSRISALINEYALKNHWDVIESFVNQGFVKTANLGLNQSKHNTLLLNSDTVVTKHWIQAFKKALMSVENIGTITSWSNNAEICSFPNFLENNQIPKNCDLIAKTLYKRWQPQYPEIPTAVGFCMLITKLAKSKVGFFNETQFGHGYGEENDYSMRVSQAKLKNILCDNAYVVHKGNESFVDLGLKPNEETMDKLLKIHPGYLKLIQQYIARDPLRGLRLDITNLLNQQGIDING